MSRITAENIVKAIHQLPRSVDFNYISPRNNGLVRVESCTLPEGPITITRWNPSDGTTHQQARTATISAEMIWRVANAITEGQPINIDRILGASYNTRSVLETLMAHSPQFYYCYPGRISDIGGLVSVEHGHKHLLWLPEAPHSNGIAFEAEIGKNMAVSEIPVSAAVYDALELPQGYNLQGMELEVARRHTQIQIALWQIGRQLGYRTWIAANDHGIKYQGKSLIEQEGMVISLGNEALVKPFDGAIAAGSFIDCIWFRNCRLMPAIMEVEHSTGVTSGLARMKNFKDRIPDIKTRYVIVAPDEDREKVAREAHKDMFKELDTRYFPYSSVEELFVICQRRKLRGVTEEFLDCYMEPLLSAS